jgi:hypothetical protein
MQLIPDATKTAILQPYIGVGQGLIPSSGSFSIFMHLRPIESARPHFRLGPKMAIVPTILRRVALSQNF